MAAGRRLPLISSLLGLPQADCEAEFAHAPAAAKLPHDTLRALLSEPMLPAAASPAELGPQAAGDASRLAVMDCLLRLGPQAAGFCAPLADRATSRPRH